MEARSHLIARFFKIILPSTITQHRLRIPPKFVDKYGDELSNVVKLLDIVDATWYVKLEKAEKTLWLNDGWKKFFDDHSIGYYYFLIFEYIGNSSFRVHIFDSTAAEVDYPTNHRDDDKCEVENGGRAIKTETSNTRSKFCGENPSFRISLKPYNLRSRCLYVPAAFGKYLPGGREHFELHDSDGNKGLINVIQHKKNGKKYLSWHKVVQEKGLKVGDTCVFECIDVNKWMLKVSRSKIQNGAQRS